jgi:hypothetical protein
MFETIRNPRYQQTRNTNPDLAQPVRNRDKEILQAYESIVMAIKAMLNKLASKQQNKYVEFAYPWQLSDHSVTKEFVCSFCSITLYLKKDEYLIELTVSPDCFNNGQGIHSTAMLRVVFDKTSDTNTDLFIENCLTITINNNTAAYFEQKADEYDTVMQKAYQEWHLKKKQGL